MFNTTDDQTEKDLEIKKIEDDTNSSNNAQSNAVSNDNSDENVKNPSNSGHRNNA